MMEYKEGSAVYCEHCRSKIPDGGGFCPECGKKVGSVAAIGSNVESNSDTGRCKSNANKKKIALIGVAAVLLVLIALGAVMIFSQPAEQQGVRIPTVEEIEKKTNSIEGDTISIERFESFDDAYYVYVDGDLAGSLTLKTYQAQCIGLYIDKNGIDDTPLAFARICVGVIEACDPSLGLDGAKEVADEIASNFVSGDPVECNGVTYTPRFTENDYRLTITVPDECVHEE